MGSVGRSGITVNGNLVSQETLNTQSVYNDISRFGFSRYIVDSQGRITQSNPNNPRLYMTLANTPLTSSNFNGSNSTLSTPTIGEAISSAFQNERSLTVQGDTENTTLADGLRNAGFDYVGESRPNPNIMPYHLWQRRK